MTAGALESTVFKYFWCLYWLIVVKNYGRLVVYLGVSDGKLRLRHDCGTKTLPSPLGVPFGVRNPFERTGPLAAGGTEGAQPPSDYSSRSIHISIYCDQNLLIRTQVVERGRKVVLAWYDFKHLRTNAHSTKRSC